MGTDPTLAKLTFGFKVFAVLAFVWASIDYSRFIKFWVLKAAPYSRPIAIAFRLFFLACVLGGSWGVIEDISAHRESATFYLSALPITIAWLFVFYLLLQAVEWMNKKRLTKQEKHEAE